MCNLHKSLGINQQFSTAYHPESQGQVESNNKWLEMYFWIFSAYQQDNWATFLHTAEFVYNHHHPSIGMTPFYANYGYHPVYTDCTTPEHVQTLLERPQHIHEVHACCQLAMDKAQGVYKRYADWHCQDLEFAVGACIWLESYNLSTDVPSKKLTAKWLGPYMVQEKIGNSSYCIDILVTGQVHNIFHASLLSWTKEDKIIGQVPEPQPIIWLQEQELWVIDCFINSCWFRGKFQLKV